MIYYDRSYQFDYLCGWRYLFSAKFRAQARQKWGGNIVMRSLFLIGSFTSILLTSAAAVLLLQLIWYLGTSGI